MFVRERVHCQHECDQTALMTQAPRKARDHHSGNFVTLLHAIVDNECRFLKDNLNCHCRRLCCGAPRCRRRTRWKPWRRPARTSVYISQCNPMPWHQVARLAAASLGCGVSCVGTGMQSLGFQRIELQCGSVNAIILTGRQGQNPISECGNESAEIRSISVVTCALHTAEQPYVWMSGRDQHWSMQPLVFPE